MLQIAIHISVLLETCMCDVCTHTYSSASPSMHIYMQKNTHRASRSTRIEEKVGETHPGQSIHHCKHQTKETTTNNKTIQGKVNHEQPQIALWRCHMKKEVESVAYLVPEKPA